MAIRSAPSMRMNGGYIPMGNRAHSINLPTPTISNRLSDAEIKRNKEIVKEFEEQAHKQNMKDILFLFVVYQLPIIILLVFLAVVDF